jgi:hypothetical protein
VESGRFDERELGALGYEGGDLGYVSDAVGKATKKGRNRE